ncbi:hypothetical protein [Vibrio vulnificus]|uniref:Uncharacterized protein n=1 Tax=Vibrio vulnificus TaxID=672 RepID=A0A2S3R1U6_VIBVL|nr:hypothetical protein [Vibrio vulnificus]POB47086.1 hypothetical protein CRN52_13490 [Vibrio vulnificus]
MIYSQSGIASSISSISQNQKCPSQVEDRPLLMEIADGGVIRGTNYWATNFNALGYVFILALEHSVVLFAPDSLREQLCKEIEAATTVEVNHGISAQHEGIEFLEIIFDDNSRTPYCLEVSVEQQAQIVSPLKPGFKSFTVAFSDGTSLSGPAVVTTNRSLPTVDW